MNMPSSFKVYRLPMPIDIPAVAWHQEFYPTPSAITYSILEFGLSEERNGDYYLTSPVVMGDDGSFPFETISRRLWRRVAFDAEFVKLVIAMLIERCVIKKRTMQGGKERTHPEMLRQAFGPTQNWPKNIKLLDGIAPEELPRSCGQPDCPTCKRDGLAP